MKIEKDMTEQDQITKLTLDNDRLRLRLSELCGYLNGVAPISANAQAKLRQDIMKTLHPAVVYTIWDNNTKDDAFVGTWEECNDFSDSMARAYPFASRNGRWTSPLARKRFNNTRQASERIPF